MVERPEAILKERIEQLLQNSMGRIPFIGKYLSNSKLAIAICEMSCEYVEAKILEQDIEKHQFDCWD